MPSQILVAYATRYGSTGEVAEAIADGLGDQGFAAVARRVCDVRSCAGLDAVVFGAPLYLGSLLKEGRTFLERQRAVLESVPTAVFALGPLSPDDGVEASRTQLDDALARLPWLAPVAVKVFVGAYDPGQLRFADKALAALPASPLHGLTARDARDWEAVGDWTRSLGLLLRRGHAAVA